LVKFIDEILAARDLFVEKPCSRSPRTENQDRKPGKPNQENQKTEPENQDTENQDRKPAENQD
jgi:hypothetical protein